MNQQTSDWNENSGSHVRIAYAGLALKELVFAGLNENFKVAYNDSIGQLEEYLGNQSILTVPDIILMEVDAEGECFKMVEEIKKSFLLHGSIIVLLSSIDDKSLKL